jgi:predicted phage tail component-like protein
MSIKVSTFTYGNSYNTGTVSIPSYACLQRYGYEPYSTIEHKTYNNESSDGLIYVGTLYKERTFTLPFAIQPYSTLNIKQTIRKFTEEFLVYLETNGVLIFDDEPDYMYLVKLSRMSVDTMETNGALVTVELTCTYPFSLSSTINTTSSTAGDTSITITNTGTHKAFPVIQFDAVGGTSVVRPKVYNNSNNLFLGYNATIGTAFQQIAVFNGYNKTLTYNGLNRGAYFMARGTFFPLESGSNILTISADSGIAGFRIHVSYYDTNKI